MGVLKGFRELTAGGVSRIGFFNVQVSKSGLLGGTEIRKDLMFLLQGY